MKHPTLPIKFRGFRLNPREIHLNGANREI